MTSARCPSVCPYPPSKTSSNRPIFKILFLLERYDIKYLSFVLFVLSVRTSLLQNEFQPSNFQNSFFCWQGMTSDTYILYFCLSIRPSVCPSVPPSPKRVLTVRFSNFFFWQSMTSDTYILYFCLSIRTPFSKTSSNSPIFKIIFLLERYLTRYLYFF